MSLEKTEGSWRQHKLLHHRERGRGGQLAADAGKEVHVAVRGSGTGTRENGGGGEN